ncbi:MAG TPA: Gfo/Idh/MocA family oxidoreductase [Thermomicrobiales bacterium]|nr:Gfo/Idh/MocA family oxidoreductase [Thermomicrobiales bacterium]
MAIRLIHAGMGGWGRDWAVNVLPRIEEIDCIACVDPDPGSLARAQSLLDLQAGSCYVELTEALAAVAADAVLATVSVPFHVPVALAALEAGKHVLLEKPFAPTLAEAAQLVETAERHRRILMISQNYRFFPAVIATKKFVAERVLGEVGSVSIDFRRNMATLHDSHPYRSLDQPLLMDMAIHHVDLLRTVLDQEATEVSCHVWNPPWSVIPGFSTGDATIWFDGGAVVTYRGSWDSRGPITPWAGEWRIECERGEIAWTSRGDLPDQLSADRVVVRPLNGPERVVPLAPLPMYDRAGSLSAFVHAIRTGTEPPCSGRDNLRTVALMNAAITSAVTGETVSVPTAGAYSTE